MRTMNFLLNFWIIQTNFKQKQSGSVTVWRLKRSTSVLHFFVWRVSEPVWFPYESGSFVWNAADENAAEDWSSARRHLCKSLNLASSSGFKWDTVCCSRSLRVALAFRSVESTRSTPADRPPQSNCRRVIKTECSLPLAASFTVKLKSTSDGRSEKWPPLAEHHRVLAARPFGFQWLQTDTWKLLNAVRLNVTRAVG